MNIDTLVIVVYDRWHNVDKWFAILEKAGRPKNVVVIMNTDIPSQVPYDCISIQRKNIGYDIGAFQDVCKNRLPGFPEDWQQLLWCTDDTFPMAEDFLSYFALKPNEGVRAMEISPYVREHIRTTGFSISRKVAEKLIFPADPVITKQHCYLFEHRWGGSTFMEQVKKMKLKVVMVADRAASPMWDSNYHRREKREQEFADKWQFAEPIPEPISVKEVVTIICPIYKSFPAVITSLIMQTFTNWKLILIHDGPGTGEVESFIRAVNDDRIEYVETEQHYGNWGHAIRSEYINKVKSEFLVITNPDNQYVPVFLEWMLKPFTLSPGLVATYCSQMVHSYRAWATQQCALARGHIDCGGVILRTKEAQEVGWKSLDHSADWIFFNEIIQRYGAKKWAPVKGTLFVHN